MSAYTISFIPEKYSFLPTPEQREQIEHFATQYGARIAVGDEIRFADAGVGFTAVNCPYCGSDCLPWWGERMARVSDGMGSYQSIDLMMPCCGQKTDLNRLHYQMPQGFYRFAMEIIDPIEEAIDTGVIARALQDATGIPWRIVHCKY